MRSAIPSPGRLPPSASLNWSRSSSHVGLICFLLNDVYAISWPPGRSWSRSSTRTYGSEPPTASASGTPFAEMLCMTR